jgi:hypothetical protein
MRQHGSAGDTQLVKSEPEKQTTDVANRAVWGVEADRYNVSTVTASRPCDAPVAWL